MVYVYTSIGYFERPRTTCVSVNTCIYAVTLICSQFLLYVYVGGMSLAMIFIKNGASVNPRAFFNFYYMYM
jgi:hypothetical protein